MKFFSTTRIAIVAFSAVGLLCSCNNKSTSFALPSTSESFGQVITYNSKVDILFVIDNSKSMIQYQQRLSARVPDMISTLNSLKMDYHIGVTTTTMASNSTYPMSRQIVGSPKYLTSANIHLLADRILAGDSGSDNERGLDSLAFVTGSYAAANAPGFIRSDALFVVIFLADENDNSSEFGNGDTNDFVNYMNTFKPPFKEGGRAWIANYIGTIQNQSCDILGGFVSVGTKYMKLADASNGIKESICSADLAVAVSNIKARIIDVVTEYRLKDIPNKSTLRVFVGGELIPENAQNGWTLEQESNSGKVIYIIKFHGSSIPAADESISVDYTPAVAS
jgi:hypothetical protein